MDVRFALPFYYRGEHFCWLQNTGHWPDIGGMVPGGFSAHATEVEQEGLRLPPVKLFKRGRDGCARSSPILNSNMRIAEQRIGDIKAQAAALKVGERRLTELIDRYGRDTVVAAIAEIRQRAAQLMRAHIAAIPDGVYRPRRSSTPTASSTSRCRIALAVTKAGETLTFDFTGSSPPCRGPMNSVVATTYSAVYLAMRHIFPDTPLNCRRLRAAGHQAARGHVPRRALSAPRVGLRGGGVAAHRRGRVPGAGAGDPRQGDGGAGRLAPATSRSAAVDPAKGRGYVMYQISGGGYGGNVRHRRPHQRLLHHRHLQEPAGRGAGAVLSRSCSAASRCARARAAPARSAAASACTTRWSSGAARRAPPSSWITAASVRPACRAAGTARPTSCACIAAARC